MARYQPIHLPRFENVSSIPLGLGHGCDLRARANGKSSASRCLPDTMYSLTTDANNEEVVDNFAKSECVKWSRIAWCNSTGSIQNIPRVPLQEVDNTSLRCFWYNLSLRLRTNLNPFASISRYSTIKFSGSSCDIGSVRGFKDTSNNS